MKSKAQSQSVQENLLNKYNADMIDGFPSYAPELARASAGFKEHYFDQLSNDEENHFWFVSRNKIIINFLKKCVDFFFF